jgi:hypothetical protein
MSEFLTFFNDANWLTVAGRLRCFRKLRLCQSLVCEIKQTFDVASAPKSDGRSK